MDWKVIFLLSFVKQCKFLLYFTGLQLANQILSNSRSKLKTTMYKSIVQEVEISLILQCSLDHSGCSNGCINGHCPFIDQKGIDMDHIAEHMEYSLLKNTIELEKPGKKMSETKVC